MADISKIKLPDGTTYDIVSEKVQINTIAGASDRFYPMLITNPPSMGSPDTIYMSASGTAPKVNIRDGSLKANMYIENISSSYSATKSSGNWSCAIDESIAYRTGNVVQMEIFFKGNGNAVSGPTNAFVGAISGGPLPVTQTTFCGYYNAVAVMGILDTDGSLSVRPLGSITLSSSSRCRIRATFICP